MTDATTGQQGSRLGRLVRSAAAALARATSRFPVTTVLVVLFSGLANAEQLGLLPEEMLTARIFVCLSGGAAASLAGHLLTEGRLANGLLRALAAAALVAAAAAALWLAEPFALYGPILVATCIGAVPIFGMAGRGSAAEFWGFILWSLAGVVLSFLAVLIFSVGVYAILQMLGYLLGVPRFHRVETSVLITALTLVGPLVALGRIPPTSGPEIAFDPTERFVRTVRPLADWVLAPLVLAAAVVLHLYAGRIAITGEVPKGQIGWIVSVFLLAVLLLRIAIDPFAADEGWFARVFRRAWAWTLAIPLALFAYALVARIESEGVTSARYFVGLWLTVGVVSLAAQLVPRTRGDIRVIAAIPFVLLLLSTFGPWGVAQTVTRSQIARIQSEFGETLQAAAPVELPPGSSSVLESRLRALQEVGTLRHVAEFMPVERRADPIWRRPDLVSWELAAFLGVEPSAPQPRSPRVFEAAAGLPLDLQGFDHAATSVVVGWNEPLAPFGMRLVGNDTRIAIRIGSVDDEFDLGGAVADLPWSADDAVSAQAPVTADLSTRDGRRLRVRVETATQGGDGQLIRLVATVLWRDAEWQAAPIPPR